MATPDLLAKVKIAVRRTDTTAFDSELNDLIDACLVDLGIAGVDSTDLTDPLIIRAVCTYAKVHFGETDEYEHLKQSYDEQKATLQMSSRYTNFADYGITSALDEIGVV